MYKSFFKPLLFRQDPEVVHHRTTRLLRRVCKLPGVPALLRSLFLTKHTALERRLFGLHFSNPVGLAAGFDKEAALVDELANLGFGFVEVGTVTPRAQPGNEQPRLFRLPADAALLNRMGFNNAGMSAAVRNLKKRKSRIIVGGNIGKNKTTPNDQAIDDYVQCFHELYDHVDYFVVNVSSPNTPDLRALQEKEPLTQLLQTLQQQRTLKSTKKPILLKIAPDLSNSQLDDIIQIVQDLKIDGVIATNTTISRDGLSAGTRDKTTLGPGGISGKPLRERSTEVIRYIKEHASVPFPIIGVGGIHSAQDALEKLDAGASLVQVYTGLVYEGPVLVKRINKEIVRLTR